MNNTQLNHLHTLINPFIFLILLVLSACEMPKATNPYDPNAPESVRLKGEILAKIVLKDLPVLD
jgi:hypothetical protein